MLSINKIIFEIYQRFSWRFKAKLLLLVIMTSVALYFEISLFKIFNEYTNGLKQQKPNNVIIILTLSIIFRIASNSYNVWLTHMFAHDLSNLVYINAVNSPMHKGFRQSELITNANIRSSKLVEGMLLPLVNVISALIFLAAYITLFASTVDKSLIYIAVFVVFGFATITLLTSVTIKQLGRIEAIYDVSVIDWLRATAVGYLDVNINSARRNVMDRFQELDLKLRANRAYIAILSLTPKFIIESLILIVFMLVIIFPGTINKDLQITSLFIAIRMVPLAQQIFRSISVILGSQGSTSEVIRFFIESENKKEDLSTTNNSIIVRASDSQHVYIKDFTVGMAGDELKWTGRFDIIPGEKIFLYGDSGVGKSQFVRSLAIELRKSFGNNYVKIITNTDFNPDIKIKELLDFYDLQLNTDKFKRMTHTMEKLELLSFEEEIDILLNRQVFSLSTGERVRLNIAVALAQDPKLLILDEVHSNLNSRNRDQLFKLLDQQDSLSCVYISHIRIQKKYIDHMYKFTLKNHQRQICRDNIN